MIRNPFIFFNAEHIDSCLSFCNSVVKLGLYFSTFILLSSFVSCNGSVNSLESKYFTEDGVCVEHVKSFVSKAPSNIKFYMEVSGSMNGFLRSNQATHFKHDVWSIVTDFVSINGSVNVFAQQGEDAISIPVNDFRSGMNCGSFVSSASTVVPDMISNVLKDVDIKASEVGVLISDLKYDPVGYSAQNVLLLQYSTDIRNIMMLHPNTAVCLIVAKSEYLDKNGGILTQDSPYYYLLFGNKSNVVFMRNFIATLLKGNNTYVDEIEWGIDYLTPSVKVSDEDYLTEIDPDKSYGDFDEECTITLDIDITNFPWFFENKDTLANRLSISSEGGTEAIVKAKNITYEISYDDGKQLKRTAIAKVPIYIKNMYEDSDVFEIAINIPEIQVPNTRFLRYLYSDNVNDVTTSYSVEGLLNGFYSSMERFKKSHPIHLLISKN